MRRTHGKAACTAKPSLGFRHAARCPAGPPAALTPPGFVYLQRDARKPPPPCPINSTVIDLFLTCSMMREMTRVTGSPMSTAGWNVSNLMYLRQVCNNGASGMSAPEVCSNVMYLRHAWSHACCNAAVSGAPPAVRRAACCPVHVDRPVALIRTAAGHVPRQPHPVSCTCTLHLLPAPHPPAPPPLSEAHQSPVTPSHSPLMRSPVMQPSSYTRCATCVSSASRAASALDWICGAEGVRCKEAGCRQGRWEGNAGWLRQ